MVRRGEGGKVKITALELRRLRMPLVAPFRTSFGTETEREVLLVRAVTEQAEGWGECVATAEPRYSPEYVTAAADVVRRFLGPRLLAAGELTPHQVAPLLAAWKGHRMAKATVETAVLDAWLRQRGEPLTSYLGGTRTRVPVGVSVGIMDSIPQLLDAVAGYLDQGYLRVKLKIEPGWDVAPVRAVRERFGEGLALQVDANAAYTLADARTLARLDEFDLLLIEQPFDEEDLRQHAALARQIRTPVCLDESIGSARAAADAIALGAAGVINIKPGRVGGYLEARRIHDLCLAHGVAVWCGGMLETGLGRAANLALAALPGFTLPGDISASERYYRRDLTVPFVLDHGYLAVPEGPGIGVDPLPEMLDEYTTASEWLTAGPAETIAAVTPSIVADQQDPVADG
jgi:O-succinylbenzoate synthase